MGFPVKVFATSGSDGLGRSIAELLGPRISSPVSFGDATVTPFANGNIEVQVDNVRGHFVVVVHTQVPPVHDNLFELFALLDAVSNSSPRDVLLVFPYMPYARSDRKNKPRISTMGVRLAKTISREYGVKKVILLDPHDTHMKHHFEPAADEVSATYQLAVWLSKQGFAAGNAVVVFGDGGAAKRYERFPSLVGRLPVAYVDKVRDEDDGRSKIRGVIGDVAGKDCILIDDEIMTATTMVGDIAVLKQHGAQSVTVVSIHAILADLESSPQEVVRRLQESSADRIVITDSIPVAEKVAGSSKFTVLSICPLLAEAIARTIEEKSLTFLYHTDSVRLYMPDIC